MLLQWGTIPSQTGTSYGVKEDALALVAHLVFGPRCRYPLAKNLFEHRKVLIASLVYTHSCPSRVCRIVEARPREVTEEICWCEGDLLLVMPKKGNRVCIDIFPVYCRQGFLEFEVEDVIVFRRLAVGVFMGGRLSHASNN